MNSQNLKVELNILSLSTQNYYDAIQAYLARIESNPHVRAIYQIGSVRHPGISDIDLVVVTDRVLDPFWLNNLSVYPGSTDELTRYLFPHDVYVFDTDSFRDIRYNIYADNLTLLAGQEQTNRLDEPEHEKWLSLQVLFDFTALRLAQFQNIHANGSIDARGVLLRVGSIKHSYRLLRRLGIDLPAVGAFSDRVQHARSHSGELSPQNVRDLFEESITHFTETAIAAATYFSEHALRYFSKGQVSDLLKINRTQVLRFSDDALRLNVSGMHQADVYFPIASFFHFLAMTRFNNLVGKSARNHLAFAGDEVYELDEGYRSVLKRRSESISRHYAFLAANRIRFAMRGVPGFVMDYHALARNDGTLSMAPADTAAVVVG